MFTDTVPLDNKTEDILNIRIAFSHATEFVHFFFCFVKNSLFIDIAQVLKLDEGLGRRGEEEGG